MNPKRAYSKKSKNMNASLISFKKTYSQFSKNCLKKHGFIVLILIFLGRNLFCADWGIYSIIQVDGPFAVAAQKALADFKLMARMHDCRICVEMIEGPTARRFIYDKDSECLTGGMVSITYLQEGCAYAFEGACRTMFIFSGHLNTGAELAVHDSHVDLPLTVWQLKEVIAYGSASSGKKIDVVGFDTCHMALLEVAHELRNYARYLIASQEYEECYGWNYSLLQPFLKNEQVSELCRLFIQGLDKDMRLRNQMHYSFSVLDLAYAQSAKKITYELTQKMDTMVKDELFSDAVWSARKKRNGSGLMAGDIVTFLEHLLDELDLLVATDELRQIKELTLEGIAATQALVLAHYAGVNTRWAHGCSMYFPHYLKERGR